MLSLKRKVRKMAEEKKICTLWERNWSATVPDMMVKKAILKGLVNPACLPPDQAKRIEKLL